VYNGKNMTGIWCIGVEAGRLDDNIGYSTSTRNKNVVYFQKIFHATRAI
jgi:hypothetical protein